MYGGSVDHCIHEPANRNFINLCNLTNTKLHKSEVSSAPLGVCFCTDDTLDCNLKRKEITVYPGEDFHISVATVGQRNGTVPGNVHAAFTSEYSNTSLGDLQDLQSINNINSCTNLTYTVFTDVKSLSLTLRGIGMPFGNIYYVKNAFAGMSFVPPELHITLQECPAGFTLSRRHSCDCDPMLKCHGINCNITSNTIQRTPPVWIGYYNATGKSKDSGLLIHPHCPFDYCTLKDTTSLNVSTLDKQCSSGRSGILCGACQPGLSLAGHNTVPQVFK